MKVDMMQGRCGGAKKQEKCNMEKNMGLTQQEFLYPLVGLDFNFNFTLWTIFVQTS